MTELTEIWGVGESTAKKLKENGYMTVEGVANATVDDLMAKINLDQEMAEKIIASAKGILVKEKEVEAKTEEAKEKKEEISEEKVEVTKHEEISKEEVKAEEKVKTKIQTKEAIKPKKEAKIKKFIKKAKAKPTETKGMIKILHDEAIKQMLTNPGMIDDLAKNIAEEISDELEDDNTIFKERILESALLNKKFRSILANKLVEEIMDD